MMIRQDDDNIDNDDSVTIDDNGDRVDNDNGDENDERDDNDNNINHNKDDTKSKKIMMKRKAKDMNRSESFFQCTCN